MGPLPAPRRPPSLVVRRSKVQGRGVFAAEGIARGARVVEYTGARITHAEADASADDDDPGRRHHTFLFAVDDEVVIDGSVGGSDARFVNHSCDPNCEIVIARRRVYIRALRDIDAGEELSYDYWYITDESYSLADLRRIYPCRCGAAICRGTLARPPERVRPSRARAKKKAAR
jgi:SET domain-containing protein